MNPLRSKARLWARIGCLAALAVGLAFSYFTYLFFHPYDEVRIKVDGVPPDTTFLCLVADAPDGTVALHWSLHKVGSFSMHPDACTMSYRQHEADTDWHSANVRWVRSSATGVLRRTKENQWFISWFYEPKSRVRGGSLLFGGGAWEVHLRDADEEERITEAAARKLGMDYALKPVE